MRSRITTLSVVVLCLLSTCTYSQTSWMKNGANPVLNTGSGGPNDPNGLTFAVHPWVQFDTDDNLYHMWFSTLKDYGGSQLCISEAISPDGLNWYIYTRNPVIDEYPTHGIYSLCVIKDAQGYKCYYDVGKTEIHLATSVDGRVWIKHAGGPVIPSGGPSWKSQVFTPSVLVDVTSPL